MYEVNDNLKLFRQAFVEAMHENTQMILAEYSEKPVFSKKHKRAMNRILSGQGKRTIKTSNRISVKTRLVAALVAAFLLLGGLTVYAHRDAVVEFIEQIYDAFTRVFFHEEQENEAGLPDTIEEERIPTYVPEGFVLQNYQSSLSNVFLVWEKDEQFIIFKQNVIGSSYNIDNEYSDFITMTIGDSTVYVKQNDNLNTYIWNDGTYSYALDCSATLIFEDVSHMIQSVSKVK